MTELKPCPFCGSRDVDYAFQYETKFTKPYSFVGCAECGGMMVDRNLDHCLNDAIEAWNRRVGDSDDSTGSN